MNTTALIRRDDSRFTISFTAEARRIKEAALDQSAAVVRVSNPAENEAAVNVQKVIKTTLKTYESARVECKEPILDFCRTIDAAFKQEVSELAQEDRRIGSLVGDYQQLQHAKEMAAEAARNSELMEIERRKAEQMASAKTLEEQQKAVERANQEAQAVPPVRYVRAEGQLVRQDWQITITDVWALARAHPMCVKIEPRLTEIRALLDAGVRVAGVSAVKAAKATVRTAHGKALDVAASVSTNQPPLGWPTE